jgi:hypothetical protein
VIYLGAGKMDVSKALIAGTSSANYKINNEASIHFNDINKYEISGFAIS